MRSVLPDVTSGLSLVAAWIGGVLWLLISAAAAVLIARHFHSGVWSILPLAFLVMFALGGLFLLAILGGLYLYRRFMSRQQAKPPVPR